MMKKPGVLIWPNMHKAHFMSGSEAAATHRLGWSEVSGNGHILNFCSGLSTLHILSSMTTLGDRSNKAGNGDNNAYFTKFLKCFS